MLDIDALNAACLAERARLPERNELPISELLSKPPYWGWVECANGADRFRMLLGGADDGVALRFLWNGGYERATLAVWAWLARRGGTIVDVGAHTGSYTLAAYAAAGPDATIVSFEPHFINFARLNLNLRGNGFPTDNAYMLGVGERNGVLPFTVPTNVDYLTTGGKIDSAADDTPKMRIQVVALDQFVPPQIRPSVRLVKIDVEGFEAQCLAGMRAILAEAGPVVFFECLEAESGRGAGDLLRRLGYRVFLVDDREGTITEVSRVAPELDANLRPLMHRLNRIAARGDIEWPAGMLRAAGR